MKSKVKLEVAVAQWLARFPARIEKSFLSQELIRWLYQREWLRLVDVPSDLDTKTTCLYCGTELYCCHPKALIAERDDLRQQVVDLEEKLRSIKQRHQALLKKRDDDRVHRQTV